MTETLMQTRHLWIALFLAALLDLALGDPPWLPHPVRLMGRAITRLEGPFRRLPVGLVLSGALFAGFLILSAYAISWGLVRAAFCLHPLAGTAVEALLLYTCLSARSLNDAALGVERALEAEDEELARSRVAMIVSRDARVLSRAGICRSAIESVGENLVDGVISPLFFAAIGGAPLALAFKMASTLDSMVGYQNDVYRLFGKASARLDDAANFLPARLSLPLISLAAQVLGRSGRRSLAVARRDAVLHKSPNSGRPEAAFAGALGVRLAGPAVYHGRLVAKPYFGREFPDPRPGDIRKARQLMVLTSVLSLAAALCAAAAIPL
ncbi:MAG: adenosylcobinamide-phosphate synthase CbiB [Thermodesulfobacteriota bacterium]